MKKLALLIAAGALWLFLAAVPAFADGGPHVAAVNSGAGVGSTLTADSCAGCHRAHTAQGPLLLAAPDEEALCLSCHGAAGTGSAVDVESGVQYTTDSRSGSNVLGALRNGGFINARIDSANPFRLTYARTATATSQRTKVSVLAAGQPVTSSHLALATGVVATGIAWGNIAGTQPAFDATTNPGGTVDGMTCASCHNPHGNGNYRILNPIPDPETVTGDTFVAATTGVVVTDAALPPAGDIRNYTVIQLRNNTGSATAAEVQAITGYNNLMGDYFHRTVPWDPQVDDTVVGSSTGLTSQDAPNGLQATFDGQINAWCATCHSRYLAGSGSYQTDSGDAVFSYRHTNTSNKPCTTCHVAHGSNATMPGGTSTSFSADFPYPDGTISNSSRLLKIDNRGTCQACHDPTATVAAGTYAGPTPANYVP